MEFGLYMTAGALNSPADTETVTYDNLNLTLTSAPEPGYLCLAGAALAGLAMLRCSGSRKLRAWSSRRNRNATHFSPKW